MFRRKLLQQLIDAIASISRDKWPHHTRRSGWNSRGSMPKVGWCRVGWGMAVVSLSSRLGIWGSVLSSPSGVRVRAPAENGFWLNLKATEHWEHYPFCAYMIKSEGDNLHSVPLYQILADLSPVIYAHGPHAK